MRASSTRRRVPGEPAGTALLRVVHIECLLAEQQRERARGAAADARAWLLEIAARIGDPWYRATFLDAVPKHRQILDLANADQERVR